MTASLAIGDFSRATHLNIKTLRHYHRIGLLVPAHVDPDTAHRRYDTDQIPTAQVIRRLRMLDMPLDEIHRLIMTGDLARRNRLISDHLAHLEAELARTQDAVASLRDLIEPSRGNRSASVEHRRQPATSAAAISAVIDIVNVTGWYQGALGELYALLAVQKIPPTGPGGAIYSTDLLTHGRGEAIVFVPCDGDLRPTGRVVPFTVPETDLAVAEHRGPHTGEIDHIYGELGAYVGDHAIGIDGPIREYYLVGARETADENQWRTEIGWPIFHTGA
ncbi:DNA-binding transcriptional MerR regulator/effector-binding domain-containing protein [Mycetocola sp. BIGb0189]|uniref:MerR family transcriptional regulator n=1 Tax=Mycetocola sp. BIGb0189 TaxID=2940604 RepID=UPI0021690449|nr:MerR family transcriptional regulator [Mycetocola sp. BIGb0189]MCS4276168.1 DNA-binding transcriptional MerR regulator/effector-binding domain-containing protein [Mycetocola sp. BIGb0189]